MAVKYFEKKFRGYDTDQVDAFLAKLIKDNDDKLRGVNEEVRRLKSLLAEREAEIKRLRGELDFVRSTSKTDLAQSEAKYDGLCAQIGEKLHLADEQANGIIAEAGKEKERIIAEERFKAESESRALVEQTRAKCASIEQAAAELMTRQQEIADILEKAKLSIEKGLSDIADAIGDNNDK